jgi:hypothetical protein
MSRICADCRRLFGSVHGPVTICHSHPRPDWQPDGWLISIGDPITSQAALSWVAGELKNSWHNADFFHIYEAAIAAASRKGIIPKTLADAVLSGEES